MPGGQPHLQQLSLSQALSIQWLHPNSQYILASFRTYYSTVNLVRYLCMRASSRHTIRTYWAAILPVLWPRMFTCDANTMTDACREILKPPRRIDLRAVYSSYFSLNRWTYLREWPPSRLFIKFCLTQLNVFTRIYLRAVHSSCLAWHDPSPFLAGGVLYFTLSSRPPAVFHRKSPSWLNWLHMSTWTWDFYRETTALCPEQSCCSLPDVTRGRHRGILCAIKITFITHYNEHALLTK